MSKYKPEDQVTVKATVAYNCMSSKCIGIRFDADDHFNGITVVVPTDSIVTHTKVPIRKGDKVRIHTESFMYNGEHTFYVVEVSGKYAWIKQEGEAIPMTVDVKHLERAECTVLY